MIDQYNNLILSKIVVNSSPIYKLDRLPKMDANLELRQSSDLMNRLAENLDLRPNLGQIDGRWSGNRRSANLRI